MISRKILLAIAFTLGFAGFNLSYADEEIIFENTIEISNETLEEEQGSLEDFELEKLLALNEEQIQIEEIEEQKAVEIQEKKEEVSSTNADKLIEIAKSKLGSPYVYASMGPNGFDCSGYTSYVFKQIGIKLPRVASSQAYGGKTVAKSDLQKGDLVFFNTFGGISHVGIYMENGNFIHASSYGRGVIISNINDSYYGPKYVTAARYL